MSKAEELAKEYGTTEATVNALLAHANGRVDLVTEALRRWRHMKDNQPGMLAYHLLGGFDYQPEPKEEQGQP